METLEETAGGCSHQPPSLPTGLVMMAVMRNSASAFIFLSGLLQFESLFSEAG